MYKIKVKPEGRKDIWIPEKNSLKKYIIAKGKKPIHNIMLMVYKDIIIGADHKIKSVLEDIDRANRLAIFTDTEMNYKHSLALIYKNELQCYDIGTIKEKYLEVYK